MEIVLQCLAVAVTSTVTVGTALAARTRAAARLVPARSDDLHTRRR